MKQPCRPPNARLTKHTGALAVAERNKRYPALVHTWHATTSLVSQTAQGKGCEVVKSICRHVSMSAHVTVRHEGGTRSVSVRVVSVSHTWQVKTRARAPLRACCYHRMRRCSGPPPRCTANAWLRQQALERRRQLLNQPVSWQAAVEAGATPARRRAAAPPRRASHRPVRQAVRHAVRLLNVQQHRRVVVRIALVAACISCEHVPVHLLCVTATHLIRRPRKTARERWAGRCGSMSALSARQHVTTLSRQRARASRPRTGPAATQAGQRQRRSRKRAQQPGRDAQKPQLIRGGHPKRAPAPCGRQPPPPSAPSCTARLCLSLAPSARAAAP